MTIFSPPLSWPFRGRTSWPRCRSGPWPSPTPWTTSAGTCSSWSCPCSWAPDSDLTSRRWGGPWSQPYIAYDCSRGTVSWIVWVENVKLFLYFSVSYCPCTITPVNSVWFLPSWLCHFVLFLSPLSLLISLSSVCLSISLSRPLSVIFPIKSSTFSHHFSLFIPRSFSSKNPFFSRKILFSLKIFFSLNSFFP